MVESVDIDKMSSFLSKQPMITIKEGGHRNASSVWGLLATHLGYSNTVSTRKALYFIYNKDRRAIKQLEQEKRLYCICRTLNDPKIPMVECARCWDWFHFRCVSFDNTPTKDYVE